MSGFEAMVDDGAWSGRRPHYRGGYIDQHYLMRARNPRTPPADFVVGQPSVVLAPTMLDTTSVGHLPINHAAHRGSAGWATPYGGSVGAIEIENVGPRTLRTEFGPAWQMEAESNNNQDGQGYKLSQLSTIWWSPFSRETMTFVLWWKQGNFSGADQRWLARTVANTGSALELSYVASTGAYSFKHGNTTQVITLGRTEAQAKFHCFVWTMRRSDNLNAVYLDGRLGGFKVGVGGMSIGDIFLFTEPESVHKNKNSADGLCLLFAVLPYGLDDKSAKGLSRHPWLLLGNRWEAFQPRLAEIAFDSIGLRPASEAVIGTRGATEGSRATRASTEGSSASRVSTEGNTAPRAATSVDELELNPREE